MGPTPPGLGDRALATSSTPSATSPQIRALPSAPTTRLTPTSSTTAPGLTISGVIIPATPAALIMMSARRVWLARSRVPVWQISTVALTSRLPSSKPIERPTVTPLPTTQISWLAREIPLRTSSSMQPRGVQGRGESIGPLTRSTRRPRLVGCKPSASLAGSMRSNTALVSMPRGKGSCTI